MGAGGAGSRELTCCIWIFVIHEPPREARSRNPCILNISGEKPTEKVHVHTTVTFCVFNICISSFFCRQGTYQRFGVALY